MSLTAALQWELPAAEVRPHPYARQRAAVQALARPELLPLSSSVGDVVLVLSSSRSGSSLLMKLLRRHCGCLALQGESNPLLRIAGLTHPESGSASDALDGSALVPWKRALLENAITCELGAPAESGEVPLARLIWWRLNLQWPDTEFDLEETARWVDRAVAESGSGRHGGPHADPFAFSLALLHLVRNAHAEVDPFRYDIPKVVLGRAFPVPRKGGETPGRIVEEPPFIIPTARRPCSSGLVKPPLLLKAPSDAYRLPFWRSLFSGNRLRVIHLTRNPAAAVNGLYDGWRYDGFHSHQLRGEPLRIQGYSHLPGGRSWWKFDLPPDWEGFADQPLERVCAFQWVAAQTTILGDAASSGIASEPDRYLRVRYEDLNVRGPTRRQTLQRLLDWLGLPCPPERAAFWDDPPLVMATVPPSSGRWRRRETLLRPVLDEPAVREVAAALGYTDESSWT